MRKLMILACAFLLVLGLTGVASANLLNNGDFETGNASLVGIINGIPLNALTNGDWDVYEAIPGWYTYDGTGIEIQRDTIVQAHSPYNYVELDSEWTYDASGNPLYSNSGMAQNVYLTAGDYELSFWYRPRTDTLDDNGIHVYFLDNNDLVLTADGISSNYQDWEQLSVILSAPTEKWYSIRFHATGLENELGGFLDDIELNAVPEPTTLLLLGFGLLGLVGLRRKE